MQAQYPAFASNTLFFLHAQSEVAVGFFGLFVSVVHDLPRLHRHAVILVPYGFFVFLLLLEER